MTTKSKLKKKARFRVVSRVVAVNHSLIKNDWLDYFGTSRTYMQACEEAEGLRMTSRFSKVGDRLYEHDFKVVHEKFVKDGKVVGR